MTSPQDFERLSAYLDNQLSAKEKAGLEARLVRESELRTALAGLRQTARALRSLPVVKPPRNFTLSPRQVEAMAQPRRFFLVLRLATVFAAIALVLVFAGDFAASTAPALSPAASAPLSASRNAEQVTIQPPAVAVMAAAATAAPAVENTGVTETTGGAASGAGADGHAQPTEAASDTAVGAGGIAPSASAAQAQTPMTAAVLAASPAVTTTEIPVPPPNAKAAVPPMATVTAEAPGAWSSAVETPTPLTVAEGQRGPTSETPVSVGVTAPSTVEQPALPLTPPLRYFEIGLVVLTLGLAVAAWLMRKR